MGTIKKQSILGTFYTFSGAIIGFVTTGLLFPKILSTEQIGLLSVIVAYANVLSRFASLGMSNVIVRFFPYFKNFQNKHNGFLFLVLTVPLIGFILAGFVFYTIQNVFLSNDSDVTYSLYNYAHFVYPFLFVILYFFIFETYYRGLHNIVLGAFLKEVLQRLLILVFLILYYYKVYDFNSFTNGYLVAYIIPAFVLLVDLIIRKQFFLIPPKKHLTKKLSKSMVSMGAFGIISTFAGMVIMNIDRIMLERMTDLSDTGIYTIAFFFGTLVILPSRSLLKISGAFVAQAWKDNDHELIRSIYKKSSITQLIIGALVTIGLLINMDNIFQILPDNYTNGRLVIVFIALAFLTDMIAGVSPTIIVNSKYYKVQTYLLILLIVMVIVTNLIFIPILGIMGAALASFISKFVANTIKIGYIKFRFGMWPFSYKHVLLFIFSIAILLINHLLPVLENYIIDIAYRSFIVSVVYGILVYIFRISIDYNQTVNQVLRKFKLG